MKRTKLVGSGLLVSLVVYVGFLAKAAPNDPSSSDVPHLCTLGFREIYVASSFIDSSGKYDLAVAEHDLNCTRDANSWRKHIDRAVARGYPLAQFRLALYLQSKGDHLQAQRLLKASATAGNKQAILELKN